MKINFKKIILFLSLAFKLLTYIIKTTVSTSSIITYLYLLIIFLLSLPYFLTKKFDTKKFLIYMSIFLFSLSILIFIEDDNLLFFTLIAILYEDEDKQKLVKSFFHISLFMYIAVLVLGILNILPNNVLIRNIDGEIQERISLGFPNPNAVFMYFIPIVLSGYYITNKKFVFNIIVLILSFILYYYTQCRTGLLVIIIFAILSLFKDIKFLRKNSKFLFIAMTIFSILFAIIFGQEKSNLINELLSSRPYLMNYYIEKGQIFSLFGKGLIDGKVLDNFYIMALVKYGFFGYFIYAYIYTKGYSFFKNDYKLTVCFIIFLIYYFCEATIPYNFVITLFLIEILKNSHKIKNNN